MSSTHTDRPALRRRFWTPERNEWLAEEWASGKSARVIGDQCGLTRSSILGKVHREGLPKRRTLQAVQYTRSDTPRRSKRVGVGTVSGRASPEKVSAPRQPAKVPVEPAANPVTFMELQNCSCRWPVIDGPPMLFCGSPYADITTNQPYCRLHSALSRRSR